MWYRNKNGKNLGWLGFFARDEQLPVKYEDYCVEPVKFSHPGVHVVHVSRGSCELVPFNLISNPERGFFRSRRLGQFLLLVILSRL